MKKPRVEGLFDMQNAIVEISGSPALMLCDCISKGERKGGSRKRMPIFMFSVNESARDCDGVVNVLQSNIDGFHGPTGLEVDVLNYSSCSICGSYGKILVSCDHHLCGQGDLKSWWKCLLVDHSFMCGKSPALLTTGMLTISPSQKFLESMKLL